MVTLLKILFENSVVCRTIGGMEPNRPCVFPFSYKNIEYTSCTTIENDGTLWCSTEVDGNGNYIERKWGNCGPECIQGND